MAASTFIFVLIGAGFVTANLMKVVEWLDAPRPRHTPRRAAAH